MAQLTIPHILAEFCKGHSRITVEARSLDSLLTELFGRYPQLEQQLFDDQQELREHILLFLDGQRLSPPFTQKLAPNSHVDIL